MAPPAIAKTVSQLISDGHSAQDAKQLQTFTRWWDSYLGPRGDTVTDLCEQIQSGVLPFRLLEALEGLEAAAVQRGKCKIMGATVNVSPKMTLQRMENLNAFFRVLQDDKKIKLVNIGSEDICAGKLGLVLGLTWELIKFYELGGRAAKKGKGASDGGVSGELLAWVSEQAGFALGGGAGAWTSDFKDGKALFGVVHAHRPDLLDFAASEAMAPQERLRAAFDAAESLGVARLLDEADVAWARRWGVRGRRAGSLVVVG